MSCAVCGTSCVPGADHCLRCGTALAVSTVSGARSPDADARRMAPGLLQGDRVWVPATLPLPGSYVPSAAAADGDRTARLLPPGVTLNGRYHIIRLLGAGSF